MPYSGAQWRTDQALRGRDFLIRPAVSLPRIRQRGQWGLWRWAGELRRHDPLHWQIQFLWRAERLLQGPSLRGGGLQNVRSAAECCRVSCMTLAMCHRAPVTAVTLRLTEAGSGGEVTHDTMSSRLLAHEVSHLLGAEHDGGISRLDKERLKYQTLNLFSNPTSYWLLQC